MSVTPEENAIADRVVSKSKSESQVDTGRLKRSINKKVQRGMIVFHEYFYGQYEDSKGTKNSTLEDNAKRMMGDIPYKIERYDAEGNIVEDSKTYNSGRSFRNEISKQQRKSNADLLTKRILAQRKKDADKESNNASKNN